MYKQHEQKGTAEHRLALYMWQNAVLIATPPCFNACSQPFSSSGDFGIFIDEAGGGGRKREKRFMKAAAL